MDKIIKELYESFTINESLHDGKERQIKFLQKHFPDFNINLIKSIDYNLLSVKFKNWVRNTLNEEPLPDSIKSIWFGLYQPEHVELYISGSILTPEIEEVDWPCDTTYFPENRYSRIEEFVTFYKWIEKYNGNKNYLEMSLYLMTSNILIKTCLDDFKDKLLNHQKELSVGFGYDSGDLIYLGQLTKDGLKITSNNTM